MYSELMSVLSNQSKPSYRLKYNKRGICNKDFLGGFLKKLISGGVRLFGTLECTFKSDYAETIWEAPT